MNEGVDDVKVGRVILALAAGVLLNALVASLCLCYAPTRAVHPSIVRGTGGDDGVGIRDNTLVVKAPYHDLGLGVHLIGVEHYWVMPRASADQHHPRLHSFELRSSHVGWPLTAFRTSEFDMSGADDYNRFVALSNRAGDRPSTYSIGLVRFIGAEHRPLPDQIAPIGFVVNSLLYAMLAYAMLSYLHDARARHRRRSDRCPNCSYSLASLPRCPECGLEVPTRTRPGAPTASRSAPSSPSAPSAFCIPPSTGAPQ